MNIAPGIRISNRGEDFIVLNVTDNFDGTSILDVEGISELVRGKRFSFDTKIEPKIQALDPINTTLQPDVDSGYRKTKLFLETKVRNSSINSDKITIAHKGAYNRSDYQYVPTLKAFELPRPRILIADGVGLGKTIEVGIFLSEMIKRGKGQRILVLALKSVLSQFQQELWNRFSIPLMRLDSRGISRIKSELPLNKNPFEFYDKTIVSIDTLKNNSLYQSHIEKTRWDIIVIDECHTVANSTSQRGDLAQLLATKCESVVLTSATPHNGRKESFANLIHMIEPIAIPKNGDYCKADVEPYYVRRFKNHILNDEVRSNFQDREVIPIHANFNETEISFLELQQEMKFNALKDLDEGKDSEIANRDFLFSSGLFKAYMSSPAAALSTLENRRKRVEEKGGDSQAAIDNIELIDQLISKVKSVLDFNQDSKYQAFKNKLIELGWAGKKNSERIVVFAERIDTIQYLTEQLRSDFSLDDKRIRSFHGGLSDVEQQEIIDDFGKEDSDIRILIASDAGSQGVNLHYYCNIMFNYDIPWSLITLEQRNGRIDRYGQKKTPYIYYLIGKSDLKGLKDDLHIIENLAKKEDEVHKALGDASIVLNLHNSHQEEEKVREAIKKEDKSFLEGGFDTSSLFGGESDVTEDPIPIDPIAEISTLYRSDSNYYTELIEQLKADNYLQPNDVTKIDDHYFEIRNTDELNRVLFDIPKEAKPRLNDIYRLSLNKTTIQDSIEEARKKVGQWAKFHTMYELHPVIRFFMTKLEASVDKDVALVCKLNALPEQTAWFVMHGQVSNNIGQIVISEFFVVPLRSTGGLLEKPIPLLDFISRFDIDEQLFTQKMTQEELNQLDTLKKDAIDFALQLYMHQIQQQKQVEMNHNQELYQQKLNHWHKESEQQLELDFDVEKLYGYAKRKKEDRAVEIKTILDDSEQYFKDITSLDNDAYIQILSVFYSNEFNT